MKTSFVIPSYTKNEASFKMLFTDCVDSFIKHHGKDQDLTIVEDAGLLSSKVVDECKARGIKCLLNEKNSGFAKSVNRGIAEVSGDIVVLVNSDVIFIQPVIDPLLKSFEMNDRVGAVGALLIYPNGTVQHGGIVLVGRGFTHRGWHKPIFHAPEVQHPAYLIGVTGALCALRKQMLEEIGMLNENYFLSCEDTELCLRAWTNDWKVYYTPDVKAIHAEGATRGRTDVEKIQNHREWYLKEMTTWSSFQTDLRKYDLERIQDKVSQANAERLGVKWADDKVRADRFVFEGTAVSECGKESKKEIILVRRTGALGDVLLATGLIRQIKKDNPSSQIIVSTVCTDVFRNNPNVVRVVRSPDGITADKFYDLDLTYEMNPKIPVWEAYQRAVYGDRIIEPTPEMYSDVSDYGTLKTKLGSINPEIDRVAVLHMAVSWSNRTWPRHLWAEVSRRLAGCGYKVIVVGRGGDYKSDMFNGVLNLVDYCNIFEIRELCKRAVVFVGMDSGMLHVAQTTDVPIVGLFTVANPKNRIVARPTRTIALVPRSDCRFCLHEKSPPVTFVECRYGSNHCLSEITPDDVIGAVQDCARKKC